VADALRTHNPPALPSACPATAFLSAGRERGGRASTLRQMAAQCLVEQERNRAILLLGYPADYRVKRWMDGLAGHGNAVAAKPSVYRVFGHGFWLWLWLWEIHREARLPLACAFFGSGLSSEMLTTLAGVSAPASSNLPRSIVVRVFLSA